MYNKVELCGVDTAQLPVLSEAEKRQLLTRARAGDAAARQAMIEGNLRLVLSVVQRLSLIHISEPTRLLRSSRMPSSA